MDIKHDQFKIHKKDINKQEKDISRLIPNLEKFLVLKTAPIINEKDINE